MEDFTEEQEQLILARIKKAQDESKLQQQWVIAGDQFYREAIITLNSKVQQGLYDNYILEVGKALYNAFRKANLQHTVSEPKEKPADEVKEE